MNGLNHSRVSRAVPARSGATHRGSLKHTRRAGLSIVELLVSLAISALLLTAVAMALDASFYAYAAAAESASTQSSSRLVMQRMLAMIRSGTVHDAYDPDNAAVTLAPPAAPPVRSVGIQLLTPQQQVLKVWWEPNETYGDEDIGDLMYQLDDATPLIVIGRVGVQRTGTNQPYIFSLSSRQSEGGLLLARATIDLTVHPGGDAEFDLEKAAATGVEIRLVGSTVPRKNIEQ